MIVFVENGRNQSGPDNGRTESPMFGDHTVAFSISPRLAAASTDHPRRLETVDHSPRELDRFPNLQWNWHS